jgi:hypothetical protein
LRCRGTVTVIISAPRGAVNVAGRDGGVKKWRSLEVGSEEKKPAHETLSPKKGMRRDDERREQSTIAAKHDRSVRSTVWAEGRRSRAEARSQQKNWHKHNDCSKNLIIRNRKGCDNTGPKGCGFRNPGG